MQAFVHAELQEQVDLVLVQPGRGAKSITLHCVEKGCILWPGSSRSWVGRWEAGRSHSVWAPLQLNHFPGSFQIGRKDRLWRNLLKMQARCGKKEFNFFPQSFILPQDIKLLRKVWEEGASRQKWIVKPVSAMCSSALCCCSCREKI